jgi:AhpD family alkylhydroperoxidase
MSERIPLDNIGADLMEPLIGLRAALARATLDKKLIDLIFLRVSQLNGCVYCIDSHAHDLRKAGESERRINALIVWRETEFFDASERAALAWAEALTHVSATHAPDEVYRPLLDVFTERQIMELTFAVGLMNLFNRIGIGLRKALPNSTAKAWREEQSLHA